MGLTQALSNAYSGLSLSSRRAEVTSHNIANSATPGFARRSVEASSHSLDNVGYGVKYEGTTLATANNLTRERREADADYGYQNELAEAAATMARVVGDSDDPGALFTRYQDFETSLATLAEDPSATHLQQDVLYRAQDLAQTFNDINEDLLQLRADADGEIERQVDFLNETLVEFDKVNRAIESSAYRGEDVTEMLAERDALIDSISEVVPLDVQEREGARVALVTTNGYPLVDSRPATISFTPANVISSDMDLIGGAPGALSGLTINGSDVTPPSATGNPLGGGSLAGLFEVRDVTTVEFQSSIDALARDLIDRFDDAAVEPTITPGDPGLFTDGQAADTGVAGLAGRLEVNNAVDPDNGGALYRLRDGIGAVAAGDAGDNTHLVAMLGALSSVNAAPAGSGVSGSFSASDLAAAIASKVDTASVSADRTLALRATRQSTLEASETAAVGVDLDYELQNLNLIQTAYSANARVLEVVDLMMRRLMEI
ncbi:MAG: flagellar hook-associated protein FlgK [Neomegalonema sp.]|nr:flagellar hook-associated protein FlgK [Neomegalonema sp.]